MSDTDSFIDEVSEELRRDQLYAAFRKWGWIPILVVIAIVGGAAYLEVQRNAAEARAEAFGDALLSALDAEDPAARIAALDAVEVPGPEGEVIVALMAAGEAAGSDDVAEAAARLRAAAEAPELDRLYADLALLKAEMLSPGPEDEARATLERLATPGAPYAPLADEQLALLEVRAGNIEAAVDRLRAIERSAAATSGLQQRARQLIVAFESGAVLIDSAPAAAPEPETGAEADPDADPVAEEPGEDPDSTGETAAEE